MGRGQHPHRLRRRHGAVVPAHGVTARRDQGRLQRSTCLTERMWSTAFSRRLRESAPDATAATTAATTLLVIDAVRLAVVVYSTMSAPAASAATTALVSG